jgi:hypothetical protein
MDYQSAKALNTHLGDYSVISPLYKAPVVAQPFPDNYHDPHRKQ